MRYLENAFRFTFKNFLITLPLLISMAIPALIMGVGSLGFLANLGKFQQIIQDMVSGRNYTFTPDMVYNLYGTTMIVSMIVAGILSLILNILVYPATYGLINKKYETGSANFSDITRCMSKYIGRYVLFILLSIAIGIGLTLVFCILIGIAAAIIITVSEVAGVLLLILFILAFIVGCITLSIYLSLWFPAVCIEDTDIIEGLKNSLKYVSGSFWTILGITLLVSLCGMVAGGILSLVIGWVPIIGSVVSPVISGLTAFITMVFYFEVYRDKTGRFTNPETFGQINGGIQ
jgi:MFS family permease